MRRLAVVGVLLSLGIARAACADGVVEVWRSPFGTVRSVSVNDADGSCWAAAGGSVMHIAADGAALGQYDGFIAPAAVSANSADGSCWVLDGASREWVLIHLAENGTELLRLAPLDREWMLLAQSQELQSLLGARDASSQPLDSQVSPERDGGRHTDA